MESNNRESLQIFVCNGKLDCLSIILTTDEVTNSKKKKKIYMKIKFLFNRQIR